MNHTRMVSYSSCAHKSLKEKDADLIIHSFLSPFDIKGVCSLNIDLLKGSKDVFSKRLSA